MLDGLGLILGWFTDDVRTRFSHSPALFFGESGSRLHRGAIRNRVAHGQEEYQPQVHNR